MGFYIWFLKYDMQIDNSSNIVQLYQQRTTYYGKTAIIQSLYSQIPKVLQQCNLFDIEENLPSIKSSLKTEFGKPQNLLG